MIVGIDFGSSTIDIALYDIKKDKYIFYSIEKNNLTDVSLEYIINNTRFKKEIIITERIIVTGGKSLLFKDYLYIDNVKITIIKISEIESIAIGSKYLSKKNIGLSASLGTGSAMVLFDNNKVTHLKGTGIGGGTLIGISNATLKENLNFLELENLSYKGNSKNINMSIKEVVGDKLGNLPESIISSFFSKYKRDTKKEDIVFGIFSFIAESITNLLIEKALRYNINNIVIGGKLSKSRVIQEHMFSLGKLFNLNFIFPKNNDYITIIGAIQQFINK
jgi:type II pantothenate kinase